MATHDYVIANGTGAAVRSDLNNALAAIVSNNSGSSEPGTTYAYQWWADTNANVLKLRNSSNDGWITLRELDGTMLIEDGSASTPGLAFADDVNTGIFSPAADQIGFATGGAERLEIGSSEVVFNDPSNDVDFRVESNGNTHMLFVDAGNDRVGIGTSAPGDTFEVKAGFPVIAMLDSDTTNDKFRIVHNGGSTQLQVDPNNVSSSSHLLVSVDGSEAARIDSSGRLLINTSTARTDFFGSTGLNSLFNIEGTNNATRATSIVHNSNDTAQHLFVLGKTRGTAVNAVNVVADGDPLGGVSFQGADGAKLVEAARIEGSVDATPGSNDMPGRLVFSTTADGASSPTERMRIDSSGNVGISTTTTSGANLVIATNSNGGSGIKLIGKSANGGAEIDFRNNADSTLNGFIEFNDNGGILSTVVNQPQVFRTNNTERMRIDSSGNVGIGTSSPTDTYGFGRVIDVRSSAGAAISLRDSDDPTNDVFTVGRDNTTSYLTTASGDLVFSMSGSQKARITSGGDFLVNRTAPAFNEKFSVQNAANVAFFNCTTNSDVANILIKHGYAQGSQTATQIQFRNDANSTVGRITSTASSTAYNTSSDYRLKENVVDLDGAIARVKQLLPKRFNFIVNPETTVDGFLAHEAQTVVPEAITGTHNEVDDDNNPVYQGIDQSKLVPLLTAALQEAIAKIETLETKVAALEAG